MIVYTEFQKNLRFWNPTNMKWRDDDVINVFLWIETWQADSSFKVPQICKFENHVTRNDIIMTSLPKTMEKCGLKPNKLYIIRNVLMRTVQKCTFYWIWATMSKVMGIYVNFWHFLQCPLSKYGHVTWPKKQISKNLYFFPILHLILGKVTKFLVEKLSTSEAISQKPHGGCKTPPPSAVRVKARWNKRKSNSLILSSSPSYTTGSLSVASFEHGCTMVAR